MTLQRRTPLRAQPRGKGNRGERAVVDMLRARGWHEARRNWMSGGQGGGDIINGPVGVHLECKWHETCRVWEWIKQAENEARPTDIPTVVLRHNRSSWWAVMPVDEFAALAELTTALTNTIVWHKRTLPLWRLLDEAAGRAVGQEIPVVRFSRPGSLVYSAAPADVVFDLLAERELA
jgi:hypothetical protein